MRPNKYLYKRRVSSFVNNNQEYNFYKFKHSCVFCDGWYCQALKRETRCLRRANSREQKSWKEYRRTQWKLKQEKKF